MSNFFAYSIMHIYQLMVYLLDRVPKKSKISERPAEFTVHSRDNSKNVLLKNVQKILKNAQSNQQFRQ